MKTPSATRGHILMTTDAVGGVWVYSSTLAQELTRRGWRVTLVTLGPAPRKDQFLPLLDNPRIELDITDLQLEWQDPEGEDEERAGWYLAALEEQLNPDIVHLNGFREALAGWRTPVLVAAHSCARSRWQACRRGEPMDAQWSRYAAQVGAGLNAADLWVAPTAAFRDSIEALYAPTTLGQVIWNGVDHSATALAQKQPFILAAGRLWDEAKNIAVLPDALDGVDWPLCVAGALHQVGVGPRPVPLQGKLEWLGDLPRHELLAKMRQASVFVSPARYEPFGVTVLEAAAAGCALVLADIPSFRELWGGAALFADPRDPASIGVALRYLCADTDLRNELAAAAMLRAARYSITAKVDAYEELYGELMRSARRRLPSSRHSVVGVAG
jgi:glycosyltransferase involved in cell wall biosynthesis